MSVRSAILAFHFNSRPSARGDRDEEVSRKRRNQISIHAPPRGATKKVGCMALTSRISIHAPPRGATWRLGKVQRQSENFNSRPSARGDAVQLPAEQECRISIHAPPRGATRIAGDSREPLIFQFTPLREGRPLRDGDGFFSILISIHAPPRGATEVLPAIL